MESEKGKIIIRKNKKGKLIFEVDIGGKKPMTIPNFYEIKDETLNNKECLVFREKGQIKKITVDKKELPKKEKKESKSKIYNQPKKKFHNNKKNQSYKIKDSFDITKTKIPKDTREALKDFKNIDNFHLKLNKYAKFNYNDGYKLQNQNINKDFFDNDWKDFYKSKIDKYYKDIRELNLKFLEIELKTDYRLVIGSEQSIYETSIRLHHIYGIPFIPSSAIKGVVRSYIEEIKRLDEFIDMFGDNKRGQIVFFDAFPITEPKIKMDIINPMEENKIINFLTVEDTTFQFLLASKEEIDRVL